MMPFEALRVYEVCRASAYQLNWVSLSDFVPRDAQSCSGSGLQKA